MGKFNEASLHMDPQFMNGYWCSKLIFYSNLKQKIDNKHMIL